MYNKDPDIGPKNKLKKHHKYYNYYPSQTRGSTALKGAFAQSTGQSKVGEFQLWRRIGGKKDVRWLQVHVRDVVGAQKAQGIGKLTQKVTSVRLAEGFRRLEVSTQIATGTQLHYNVDVLGVAKGIQQCHDVGIVRAALEDTELFNERIH